MRIDVEVAAFAYLMAETEAIAKHNQMIFVYKDDCGSSLCIGGHIAYATEQEAVFKRSPDYFLSGRRVVHMLQGLSLEEAIRKNNEEIDSDHAPQDAASTNFYKTVIFQSNEQAALDGFKEWVETYVDEDQVKEFHDLITLDTEKLKQRVLV